MAIRPIVSDERIVELLLARSNEGMSLLYDKFSAALLGVLMRMVQDNELAEELLQDSLMKAWRGIESYAPERGRLFTWLLNITRNTAIDHLRKKPRPVENRDEENLVNLRDAQEQTAPTDETLDVKAIADRLPADHRILIDLVYFKGYSQSEAAESLEIPLGTVKTRLRTAIKTLRTFFA